jgi:hypothetical protein
MLAIQSACQTSAQKKAQLKAQVSVDVAKRKAIRGVFGNSPKFYW